MATIFNTDQILRVIRREKIGHIPVMGSMFGFMYAQSSFTPGECEKEPEKFAAAYVEFQKKFEISGFFIGNFQAVVKSFGQGLIDQFGRVSVSGDGTVHNREDLQKLHPFDIDDCPQLDLFAARIRRLKDLAPDSPRIVIINNPVSSAFYLLGGQNCYVKMRREPDFVREATALFVDPIARCVERLVAAGADIIWLPLAPFSRTCISRQCYEDICHESNREFNQIIKKHGRPLIVHTCGNWNDRFDLAVAEGPDALHVAEADLGRLKREHGRQVALMGQIPAVFTMFDKRADDVYAEALEQCRLGAEGGGYILAPDCGLPLKTPPENVHALVRAARDAEAELAGRC